MKSRVVVGRVKGKSIKTTLVLLHSLMGAANRREINSAFNI